MRTPYHSHDHESYHDPSAILRGLAVAILLSIPIWLGVAACVGLI